MTDQPQKKKNGWSAYHALKRKDKADRQELIDGLLRELDHPPTARDRIDAEVTAADFIEARRLERAGRNKEAGEVRNRILRAQRGTIKARPASEKKPKRSGPADVSGYLAGEITP